jgi:hypothetical protein
LLHDGPDGSLDAFLSGLEPELAAELRDALNGAAAPPESANSPGSRGEPAGGEAER